MRPALPAGLRIPIHWYSAIDFASALSTIQKNTVNPTQLMQLNKGDIILFGSRVDWQFALDTVLVIENCAPLRRGTPLPNWELDLHEKITMDLFDIPKCGVTLDGGATGLADKPFSFVPCHPSDGTPCSFRRPVIEPSGIFSDMICPRMPGGHKITRLDGVMNATDVWSAVVQVVLSQGCHLGTAVDDSPDAQLLSGRQLRTDAITAAAEG